MKISFESIISLENLLEAWQEFQRDKARKLDVQQFGRDLVDNLLELHKDLANFRFQHGGYQAFSIADPKPRRIHKASVRDRLVHHAIHRSLYPFFDRLFVADSFSCRKGKGTHRAMDRLRTFAARVSKNHTRTCWVLKCDIRKFFDSVNHEILMNILTRRISDQNILWLLQQIIVSFHTLPGRGLPLGNLTSQLLVNIYMNELDQFVKHVLKVRHYVRYADDFVLLSQSRAYLERQIPIIDQFLRYHLALTLHPDKVFIKTLASGVDFLGWVHFPDHRVLRTTTAKRMKRRIFEHPTPQTLQSYLGLLKHGQTQQLQAELLNNAWLFQGDTSEET